MSSTNNHVFRFLRMGYHIPCSLVHIAVLVYTKTVDSADWFVKLRISCAIYLRATREKMASRFASVTSEEMIQIIFLWCILSHFFSIIY